jgi:hypothetical protein
MMSLAFSAPAGTSVWLTGVALISRIWTGFQPSSAAFLIACAPNFGVVIFDGGPLKRLEIQFPMRFEQPQRGSTECGQIFGLL